MTLVKTDLSKFVSTLSQQKRLIDADIETYSGQLLSEATEQFGEYPAEAVSAYCQLLNRGGKRIRGALSMTSYEMLGGTNNQVAKEIARAIEMLHAYILMVDDIQDRSDIRRGGPTAHVMLKSYHEKHHLKDDSQHFGESIAMNGFLFGAHSALNVVANLGISADIKIRAIKNINDHFIATAHGQSLDIFNEVVETVDERAVNNVLLWKTAFYTFMNPLQLGAILAGASENDLSLLKDYSLHAGRVFQITDDVLGIFGSEEKSGKSPLDDIKEGKRTILTVKALELADRADSYFLESMLGNKQLTAAEFQQVRTIVEDCGALDYARDKAKESVIDALAVLARAPDSWGREQAQYLASLVQFLLDRKA